MFVAIFAISLIFAIMFHEFGHYAAAKAFGMKVEKFFLGFGPTLWSFRRGETEYGVKAFPAGGFVKIVGMSETEEIAPQDRGRTFYEQSAWKRVIVLSAGSATHFVLAFVLIFCGLAFVGLPDPDAKPTSVLDVVVAGTPASEAGLQPGDRVVAVNGEPTPDFDVVRGILSEHPGEEVQIAISRAGEDRIVAVTLDDELPDGTKGAFLGVGPSPVIDKVAPLEALRRTTVGDFSVFSIAKQNLAGLGTVLNPSALSKWFSELGNDAPRTAEGPVSPVGVGQLVNALGQAGDIFNVLFLLAVLNITLGTLNMLPLPPLDGGHLAVLLIEQGVNGVRRLRGRTANWRIDPAIITPVALAVIVFFVVLSLTALYVDIVKPASGLLEQ